MRACEVTLAVDSDGREAVLGVQGELDVASVAEVLGAADDALTREIRHLTVDLAGITFCDSRGLDGLAEIRGRAAGFGVGVVLRDPAPSVRRLVSVLGPPLDLAPA